MDGPAGPALASRGRHSGDHRREIETLKSQQPLPGKEEAAENLGPCGAGVRPPQAIAPPGSQDGTCFRQREGFAWTLAAAREGPGSMNYADEIRRQAEAAPRAALPAVTAALWRAYGDGKVTEAEAEALSGLIEGRRVVLD